jgi:hypothetical protein
VNLVTILWEKSITGALEKKAINQSIYIYIHMISIVYLEKNTIEDKHKYGMHAKICIYIYMYSCIYDCIWMYIYMYIELFHSHLDKTFLLPYLILAGWWK